MLTLVIIKNPFQPDLGREIKKCEYKTVGELRQSFNYDVTIEVDGWRVADDYEFTDTDNTITVKPVVAGGGGGSSKVFAIVAAVGLAVATGGALALAGGVWGAASWIAASVVFAGSLLFNRNSKAKVDTGTFKEEKSDPTYSWGGVQTMEGQNNVIPLTYGKVMSGGQTIGKRVDYANNKETLNWLVGAGEGELTFSDIKLNDTPIGNYTGVTLVTRPGTNDQEIIDFFNDTTATKSLSYEILSDSWRTEELSGDATEGLIISIECSQGLYYANDSGGLDTAWVDIACEYKLHSASTWTRFSSTRVSGAQQTAIRRQISSGRIPPGQYDVRLIVTGRSHGQTNRSCTRIWWTMVSSVVYDDFTYPNIGLIGIKALATDQLSGSPSLSFIKERAKVWVWDADAKKYVQKNANNPAWACYDLLHQARRLTNIHTWLNEFDVRGVNTDGIIYSHFKEWAAWCDTKNIKVNIELTTSGEMLDVINNNVANIGRGKVVRFGTRYGAIWDREQLPVQMFGMGNILKGSFKEEFLSTNDRANCVEITYNDAARNYERQTIMIFGSNYDTDPQEKPTQLTLNGCTSYEQAYREGKYQMFSNERLIRTVTFNADIDSIACTIGDVITVSHDVPQWAYSGRIEGVDNDEVLLPCEIEDLTANYVFAYRAGESDTRYETPVTILSSADGWTKVKMTTPPLEPPTKWDIFDLAISDKGSKPFKVINITRAADFQRTITCIEYDAAVYSEDYEIPPIEYTMGNDDITDPTQVTAEQVQFTDKDGQKKAKLFVSWERATSGGQYNVYYSTDGKNYTLMGKTADTTLSGIVGAYTTYYVKVQTVKTLLVSRGVVVYPVPPGSDVLPPNVTALNAEYIKDGTRRYYWTFDYPDPNDIAGFKMKYGNNWATGQEVQEGLITSQPYEATSIRQGQHTVMIKAVDNAGNESAAAAFCIVDFGTPLVENVLYKVDYSENEWAELLGNIVFWPHNSETMEGPFWPDNMADKFWVNICGMYVGADGYLHTETTNKMWTGDNEPMWTGDDKPMWGQSVYMKVNIDCDIIAPAGGYFWLDFDISGNETIWYWLNNDTIRKQYSTRVKVKPGDTIHINITAQNSNVIIRKLIAIIDVPDRVEHFKQLDIGINGVELPIQTPNYKTTAVHIDTINIQDGEMITPKIISSEPCVIQAVKADGTPVAVEAQNITWQGYEQEVIPPNER